MTVTVCASQTNFIPLTCAKFERILQDDVHPIAKSLSSLYLYVMERRVGTSDLVSSLRCMGAPLLCIKSAVDERPPTTPLSTLIDLWDTIEGVPKSHKAVTQSIPLLHEFNQSTPCCSYLRMGGLVSGAELAAQVFTEARTQENAMSEAQMQGGRAPSHFSDLHPLVRGCTQSGLNLLTVSPLPQTYTTTTSFSLAFWFRFDPHLHTSGKLHLWGVAQGQFSSVFNAATKGSSFTQIYFDLGLKCFCVEASSSNQVSGSKDSRKTLTFDPIKDISDHVRHLYTHTLFTSEPILIDHSERKHFCKSKPHLS